MSKQNYTNEYIWRYIYTVVTYVSLFVIAHDMSYRMCRGCCTYHRGTSGAGSHYHWLEALVWAVHSTRHFISRQQGTGYIVVSVKKLFLWVCSFPMLCVHLYKFAEYSKATHKKSKGLRFFRIQPIWSPTKVKKDCSHYPTIYLPSVCVCVCGVCVCVCVCVCVWCHALYTKLLMK